VLACSAYAATAAFLAWGFQTPSLDRIWTLDHELKIGRTWNLTDEDLAILRNALRDYPGLAEALLNDTQIGIVSAHRERWVETPEVTVIRTKEAGQYAFVELDVQTPRDHLPLNVTVKGETWKHKLSVAEHGPVFVPLPKVSEPELFTIDFKGKELRADPSILRTRVSFHEEAPE
jgi:hypothetical protein